MYDFNTPLKQLTNYPSLKIEKNKHNKYENTVSVLGTPTEWINPKQLMGLEFEIEGFVKGAPYLDHYWSVKDDHSLRNHGFEFTSIPLAASQFDHAYDLLSSRVHLYNPEPTYSPRCSVHVHMNVRDYTVGQLINLILLYCMFERHFFLIAGKKRESSIFCVPLYKSFKYMSPLYNIRGVCENWHKYNALNLGTVFGTDQLPNYGTVEYRHLYGTLDKDILVNWIKNIQCLHKAAENMNTNALIKQLETINTTSEYLAMYSSIFGEYQQRNMLKYDFEHQITILKLWLFGKQDLHYNNNSPYHKLFNKLTTNIQQNHMNFPDDDLPDLYEAPLPKVQDGLLTGTHLTEMYHKKIAELMKAEPVKVKAVWKVQGGF